jgi:hypothetical protein
MRKSFLVFPYSECIGRINVLPPLAHCCGHMGVIREENYLIFSESKHPAPNSYSPQVYKTLNTKHNTKRSAFKGTVTRDY